MTTEQMDASDDYDGGSGGGPVTPPANPTHGPDLERTETTVR